LSETRRLLRKRDINHENDIRVDAELREVESRLREYRPTLTALEFDAIKLRTLATTRKSPSPFAIRRSAFMKSRFAIVLVVALGVFMSGSGASLAVSSLANSGSASSAQYAGGKGHNSVLGDNESGANEPAETETVTPEVETEAVQPLRQVATSSSGTLPFTGFLAIPVLIIGVGLLGAGVMMRVRMRSGNRAA
jgi:hypothetical protein